MPSRAARLLGFVRPYRTAVVAGAALSLVASALDGLSFALLIPFLRLLFGLDGPRAPGHSRLEAWLDQSFGALFDAGEPAAALRNLVLLMLSVVAVKNAALYGAGLLRVRAQENVGRDLRLALHSHLQRMGLEFFTHTRGGQIAARLTSDPDQAKLVVGQVIWSVVQSGTVVLVYVALLFAISARLTLLALVLAPAIAGLLHPLLARVRARLRGSAHERGELTALAVETTEAARVVKAHGGARAEEERAARAAGRYGESIMRVERLALLAHPVSETLGAAVVLAIVTTGSVTALAGSLRPEALIAFLAVTLRLLPPVKALSHVPALAEQALVAAERVFDLLDRAPTDVDPPGSPAFPGFEREIELQRVWVAYDPERWVLRDVTLRIQRGEIVAIVGPSGAGKSTLLDLLPRFVEPASGDVLIDGVPVRRYDRRSLRRALGIVSQHAVLFHDTVMRNIAYGDRAGASREEVEAAARAANAHEFIERLPQGYHTVLGERGSRLSGGERQRIAIARALLREPEILLLDEATSSLDAESERLIHEAIGRLAGARTVLMVAHRSSTVAYADRVLRLERGRLAAPDLSRTPRAARGSAA
jgi:subfamily B ATP-binding cassette protein MsbA